MNRRAGTGFAAQGAPVRTKPSDTRYRTAGPAVRPETYRRYVQAMQRSEADFRQNFGLARRDEDRVPILAGTDRAGYAAQVPTPARETPKERAVRELEALDGQLQRLYEDYDAFQQGEVEKLGGKGYQAADAAKTAADAAKQRSQELTRRTQQLRGALTQAARKAGLDNVGELRAGLDRLEENLGKLSGSEDLFADYWSQFEDEDTYEFAQFLGGFADYREQTDAEREASIEKLRDEKRRLERERSDYANEHLGKDSTAADAADRALDPDAPADPGAPTYDQTAAAARQKFEDDLDRYDERIRLLGEQITALEQWPERRQFAGVDDETLQSEADDYTQRYQAVDRQVRKIASQLSNGGRNETPQTIALKKEMSRLVDERAALSPEMVSRRTELERRRKEQKAESAEAEARRQAEELAAIDAKYSALGYDEVKRERGALAEQLRQLELERQQLADGGGRDATAAALYDAMLSAETPEEQARLSEEYEAAAAAARTRYGSSLAENEAARKDAESALREMDAWLGGKELEAYGALRGNADYETGSWIRESAPKMAWRSMVGLNPDDAEDVYYAVNGQGSYRWSAADGRKYNYMEEEERQLFTYVYNTQGKEAAEDYLAHLTPQLNSRMSEETARIAANLSELAPLLADIVSVGANLAKTPAAFADFLDSMLGNEIDINDARHQAGRFAGGIRANRSAHLQEKYGAAAGVVYQMGMGVADGVAAYAVGSVVSGVLGAAGQALGSAASGFGAASGAAAKVAGTLTKDLTATLTAALTGSQVCFDSIVDGKLQGWDDAKAVSVGVVRGLIEGITQKFSLGEILKSPARTLKGFAKSFVAEGSQELATNWTNRLVDKLSNDRNSIENRVKAYMEEGLSEDDALMQVLGEAVKEDLTSFLAGGFTGAVFNYLSGGKKKTDADANARSPREALDGMDADGRRPALDDADYRYPREALDGMDVEGRRPALDDADYRYPREALDGIDVEGRRPVLDSMDADAEFGPYTEANKLHRAAWDENRKTISRNFGYGLEPPKIMAELGGKPVEVGARFRDGADGMQVQLADRRYVPLSELKFKDATVKTVYDAAGRYDALGAQSFLDNYTPNIPFSDYVDLFNQNYKAQIQNSRIDTGNPTNMIMKDFGAQKRPGNDFGQLDRNSIGNNDPGSFKAYSQGDALYGTAWDFWNPMADNTVSSRQGGGFPRSEPQTAMVGAGRTGMETGGGSSAGGTGDLFDGPRMLAHGGDGASDGTPLRPNQIMQEGQADVPGPTGTGDSGDPLHSGDKGGMIGHIDEQKIFEITPEMEKHIIYVDPETPRRRGIGGAHSSDEFFKNDIKIVKSVSHPDIQGVTYYVYNLPELGKDGKPTGRYGRKNFEKTVFDSKQLSHKEYIRRGLEAAKDAYKKNGMLPRQWEGFDLEGIKWIGYGKDGNPTSFFPDVPK